MRNIELTTYTAKNAAFTVKIGNTTYTASKNDVEIIVEDITEDKKLDLRSNSGRYNEIKVDLNIDTFSVNGLPYTSAQTLRDVLIELVYTKQ